MNVPYLKVGESLTIDGYIIKRIFTEGPQFYISPENVRHLHLWKDGSLRSNCCKNNRYSDYEFNAWYENLDHCIEMIFLATHNGLNQPG